MGARHAWNGTDIARGWTSGSCVGRPPRVAHGPGARPGLRALHVCAALGEVLTSATSRPRAFLQTFPRLLVADIVAGVPAAVIFPRAVHSPLTAVKPVARGSNDWFVLVREAPVLVRDVIRINRCERGCECARRACGVTDVALALGFLCGLVPRSLLIGVPSSPHL